MAVVRSKGAWKKVKVEESLLSQSDFQCFGGLEVLEDYEILEDFQSASGKKSKSGLKRKSQQPDEAEVQEVTDHQPLKINSAKKAKRKKKSKKVKHPSAEGVIDEADAYNNSSEPHDYNCVDENDESLLAAMVAWKDLFVPLPVLRALHDMEFTEPTLIQSLVLPSAIRDKKDILGAAETGSGKTLAFGIPLIHSILRMKGYDHNGQDLSLNISDEKSVEAGEAELSDDVPSDDGSNADDSNEHSVPSAVDGDQELQDPAEDTPVVSANSSGLYALVLTPTRELAVQVRDHINNVAKYTDVKAIAIFGGMSSQKQERLLRRQPEIVVGTPGRLWELYEQGNPHMLTITRVPLVVVDEADRMVEKGHFEELTKIFAVINENRGDLPRQTLVFSATLTYVHELPSRLKTKRKKQKLDREHKIAGLIDALGMHKKPKIVDVTRPSQTVQTLLETRSLCRTEEKDTYLYYFLKQHPGRTIVFANSIDSIRRLVSVFTLLRCTPLPLHSEMHQKQRLKNLERFAANADALLIATDVAARGLDIPNIDHVVHFQVPRTCESYVHRSGRTARACKEGLSLMLIDENAVSSYRKLVKSLNKGEDLAMFPVDQELLHGYRERVELARQIDSLEHSVIKKKKTDDWFTKAAEEADILLDDVTHSDEDAPMADARTKNKLKSMKQSLATMLRLPANVDKFCGRYPTQSGKLVLPASQERGAGMKSALSLVKSKSVKKKQVVD